MGNERRGKENKINFENSRGKLMVFLERNVRFSPTKK